MWLEHAGRFRVQHSLVVSALVKFGFAVLRSSEMMYEHSDIGATTDDGRQHRDSQSLQQITVPNGTNGERQMHYDNQSLQETTVINSLDYDQRDPPDKKESREVTPFGDVVGNQRGLPQARTLGHNSSRLYLNLDTKAYAQRSHSNIVIRYASSEDKLLKPMLKARANLFHAAQDQVPQVLSATIAPAAGTASRSTTAVVVVAASTTGAPAASAPEGVSERNLEERTVVVLAHVIVFTCLGATIFCCIRQLVFRSGDLSFSHRRMSRSRAKTNAEFRCSETGYEARRGHQKCTQSLPDLRRARSRSRTGSEISGNDGGHELRPPSARPRSRSRTGSEIGGTDGSQELRPPSATASPKGARRLSVQDKAVHETNARSSRSRHGREHGDSRPRSRSRTGSEIGGNDGGHPPRAQASPRGARRPRRLSALDKEDDETNTRSSHSRYGNDRGDSRGAESSEQDKSAGTRSEHSGLGVRGVSSSRYSRSEKLTLNRATSNKESQRLGCDDNRESKFDKGLIRSISN